MNRPIQKIFMYGKSHITVHCQDCGKARKLKSSDIQEIPRLVTVKCGCGATFNVLFEKRFHYRKVTHLEGHYSIKVDPDGWLCHLVVKNLSRNGIGFKMIGKYDIQEGDVLNVQFSLDDENGTQIKSNVVVRSVSDNYIGAEFSTLDMHAMKELGFYLMP